ncbi:centrosomal protein of 104 kDa-like isoform X2 [Rhopilema esculentum]|uniref:centrosomal protein of 104 kDa-like isoform X2 n=1 Tax=Rhopilema esculentum TaxID=499914 RepID=UPI0031DFA240
MPRKLQFQVVHVSGHEPGYGPKELELHSPVTKGWQSQKFCVYPQEVVLKLKEPANLRKLQILSHQYLIASKVEIFAGLASNQQAPSLINCKFTRLGYVSLSSNEQSNFKTRELKSVSLNIECQFVKFLVHKNHVNKHNLYNQINVIAVNLIGDPIDEMYSETKKMNLSTAAEDLVEKFMSGGDTSELRKDIVRGSRPDYISPLDDLAFDIYQDSETAQLIRRLEAKKQDAVLEERFDYAKKLKQAMADLQKVGEKLGRFEVEKRRAIEIEDYDMAKAKKLQADEYRLHVYKQLDLPDLLEIKQVESKRQQPPSVFITSQIHSKQQQHSAVLNEARLQTTFPSVQSDSKPHTVTKSESPVLPPIVSPASGHILQMTTVEHESTPVSRLPRTPDKVRLQSSPQLQDPEDRPIPALKSKGNFEENLEFPSDGNSGTHDEEKPGELSERDESEATPIIDVYGLYLVQLAYSKIWKHRQDALEKVMGEISVDDGKLIFESEPKAIVRATTLLLKKMLQDNVVTVFTEAVKVESTLLADYIPRKKLGKSEYAFVVDKTIPVLLTRVGDMAPRTKESAVSLIQDSAVIKEVKALGTIPEMLVHPLKSKGQVPWRLFKGRIEVIHNLLEPLDVDKQGSFTTDGVMQFVKKAIEHSNKEVREAGIALLLDMYKKVGNAVRAYLPPDEPSTRKNPLYSRIFDGLDKIDGKPTKAEQKLQAKQEKEETEKVKKQEIAALQAQLKELRALKEAADETKSKGERPNDTTVTGDLLSQDSDNIDHICIFCGDFNEKLSQETLDGHYAKSCPMLKKCNNCSQVIEICNLNEHLLTECERKADFKKCPRCQEAIAKPQLDSHVKAKACPATRGDKPFNRCPLCKEKVADGEEGWKKHLVNDCKANTKRLQQQKKVAKTGGKQPPDKKTTDQKPAGVVKRRTSRLAEKSVKTNDGK